MEKYRCLDYHRIMLGCFHTSQTYTDLYQTVQEMDFERGIWMAAKDGDLERVKTLLGKGVSPNQDDSAGYRPLHYAARNGHYRVCKLLLDNGAEVNAVTRSLRATALHRAVMQNHHAIIDLLLQHNADVNFIDVDGSTALHRAVLCRYLNERILKLLVSKTDLEIRDIAGRTVEDLARLYFSELVPLIQKGRENPCGANAEATKE